MSKAVMGFHFQTIPLEEAQNAVMAGDGNYAEVKTMLLEKLPEIDRQNSDLAPKEKLSFAFGLPKGEIPEDQRRGICMAVNSMLKKTDLFWKITYSGTKHLFVCIPRTVKIRKGRDLGESNGQLQAKVLDLKKSGGTLKGIAAELGITLSKVNYILYGTRRSAAKKGGYLTEEDRIADYERKKNDILDLKKKGLMTGEISTQLGINHETVKSIYYNQVEKRRVKRQMKGASK